MAKIKEETDAYKVPTTSQKASQLQNQIEEKPNIVVEPRVAGDSSPSDTDSDFEDIVIPNKSDFLPPSTLNGHLPNGVVVLSEHCTDNNSDNSNKPKFDSIAVHNSTDITFGDKTYYQGPVTIKQFLLDKNKWQETQDGATNGGFDAIDGSIDRVKESTDSASAAFNNEQNWYTKLIPIQRNTIILMAILITTALAGTILIVIYVTSGKNLIFAIGDGDDNRGRIPIESNIGNDTIPEIRPLRIVPRAEWLAQPANNVLVDLELPAKRVIIAHTATEFCTTQAQCTFQMKKIQEFHMQGREWDDIGYNFLVGGDGNAYEGRGFTKVGAHTKGYNFDSICIAFIGTFNSVTPPIRQLSAAEQLIQYGVNESYIAADYKLFGHRQLTAFESPGEVLYKIITKWPHWSNQTITTTTT